jgi:hypothetical protein
MVDDPRGNEYIQDAKVVLVEGVFKHSANDSLVVLCGHGD